MGCDGGSIPKRTEIVKEKKKEERPDQKELIRMKSFSCALTKETLRNPVVSCELGYLFNKEAILNQIIERKLPKEYKHIKSLKVRSLNYPIELKLF
jgi:hypothetical protein